MSMKRLSWDSDFFGVEVYSVTLGPGAGADYITGLKASLMEVGAELTYVFHDGHDPAIHAGLTGYGAHLYDEKITYAREIKAGADSLSSGSVKTYDGTGSEELKNLALLAGHESRFKKDPRLSARFNALYTLWLENSLNGTFADRVFVYMPGKSILGFLTCKITGDGVGSIGLIASAEQHQGKGIGRELVLASDVYYQANKVSLSTVVTQGYNVQACKFYERAGFKVYKQESVYHWWFK